MLALGEIPRVRAALSESTPVWPVGRRRDRSRNHVQSLLVVTDVGHRVHQALGVGMMRSREELVDSGLFDYLARVHHNDTRRRLRNYAEVVGDHQNRSA